MHVLQYALHILAPYDSYTSVWWETFLYNMYVLAPGWRGGGWGGVKSELFGILKLHQRVMIKIPNVIFLYLPFFASNQTEQFARQVNSIRVHFFDWHVRYTVIIFEEGNLLHPQCPQCDMLVPWCSLNRRHLATAPCAKGVDRNRQRPAEEELR